VTDLQRLGIRKKTLYKTAGKIYCLEEEQSITIDGESKRYSDLGKQNRESEYNNFRQEGEMRDRREISPKTYGRKKPEMGT